MSEIADKLRSLATPRKWGRSERKPVQNELDGTQAGYHVEHWDDSQDAVATPKTVKLKAKTEE